MDEVQLTQTTHDTEMICQTSKIGTSGHRKDRTDAPNEAAAGCGAQCQKRQITQAEGRNLAMSSASSRSL